MATLPPADAGGRPRASGAALSLISLSFAELRRDLRDLLRLTWDEPVRRRAQELATVLAQACERQGLPDLAGLARRLANLTRLSRDQAVPLRAALREKAEELLRSAARALAAHRKRRPG